MPSPLENERKACPLLIQAGLLLSQDAGRRVLSDAALAIGPLSQEPGNREAAPEGRILDLGPRKELERRWQAERVLDLRGMLVMPGLINAHTHAAMTFLRGLADDLPLMDWLTTRVFPLEARLKPEIVRLGALLGHAELLASGCTASMDMYLFADAVLEAAQISGMRCMAGEAVFDFPSAACKGAEEALARTRDLAAHYKDHPRLKVAVNAHSVYTCSPESLELCRDLARESGLPLHIHLAETRAETARCLEQYGARPIAHCARLGLLDLPLTCAHLVDLEPDEIALLAEKGAVCAHNPASNMKLASGAAPLAAMLASGMAVGLGTDGPASNNQLNLFSEMRLAALLPKLTALDPTLVKAEDALDMATLGGARALHQPELGKLEIGGPADLIALDLSRPGLQPMHNPVSQLVYAATGQEVRLSMVGGEILYQDGKFSRFDYQALLAEVDSLRLFAQGQI